MTPLPDLADKDAIIAAMVARIEKQTATNALLVEWIAELEANLATQDAEQFEPATVQGAEALRFLQAQSEVQSDAASSGFRLSLRGLGRGRVLGSAKLVETYARIEIPKIEPGVTQVLLHGGV